MKCNKAKLGETVQKI